MASFAAFLEVGGKRYPLYRFEFSMHQETDTLGRPASPVLGGTIVCVLSSPGSQDPFLYQWMLSPTMQQDGKIVLTEPESGATLKTISFFNAYCTQMDLTFRPGQNGGAGSSLIQLQISPQRVAVGAILHDNNWPVASHGSGESFAKQVRQEEPQPKPKPKPKPGLVGTPPISTPRIPKLPPMPPGTPPRIPPPKLPQIPRSTTGLPALASAALAFIAAMLYPHEAGVPNEWEKALPAEEEQRWQELDKKRRELLKEGKVLPAHEYEEWLALDQRKFPYGRDANGKRPYALTGSVTKNKLSNAEYQQAVDITDKFGGHIEGQQTSNEPGIDGWHDGKPISLKEYDGSSPLGVLKHVSKAEQQASKAGYKGVGVYVKAKNLSSDQLIDFASKGGLKDIPKQGTVDEINVETADGWVRIGPDGVTKLP